MTTNSISTWVTLGLAAAGALVLSGCPNPNTYGTPRTTPAGKLSHTIAAEGLGYKVKTGCTPGTCPVEESGSVPLPPTYQLRVGLMDQLDLGARVANMTSLGLDIKWNFLKSEVFDVAIDPGFQFFQVSATTLDSSGRSVSASTNVVYLHGPLLLGLNAGKMFSVVLTPGVTYGLLSADINSSEGVGAAQTTSGLLGRLGIGLDFRIFDSFAIHPEVTFMKSFDDSSDNLLYIFGLGFNFGHLPDYSDQRDGAAPPPGQPPPGPPPG
jgi:hypothetical protein